MSTKQKEPTTTMQTNFRNGKKSINRNSIFPSTFDSIQIWIVVQRNEIKNNENDYHPSEIRIKRLRMVSWEWNQRNHRQVSFPSDIELLLLLLLLFVCEFESLSSCEQSANGKKGNTAKPNLKSDIFFPFYYLLRKYYYLTTETHSKHSALWIISWTIFFQDKQKNPKYRISLNHLNATESKHYPFYYCM